MKKIALFLSLFTLSCVYAQSLPINFEGSVTTSDFLDFDGGGAAVIANPFMTGINTSDSVARLIRGGGAIWAGSKIALSANLDFSVLTKLTMKVYTTAPVGTMMKFKLEGTGASAEVDAFTTTSGSWETLEWIFAGTSNDLNELVFMFDFGNVGDSTASSTFYFDDVEQVAGPPAPGPTTLPIDFESGIVSSDFLDFSGATSSVLPNPEISGINTSATVCQIVRSGGDLWAGSKILLDSTLDLSSMWHISMKVFTQAPVGTRVKLELEGATGSTNLDVLTTVTGAWETLSFNFDGQPNDFDKLVFLFDFGNVGDGSATSTFLFDDVQQFVGPALPDPIPAALPIDFESSVVSSDFTNFFGGIGTVVPNPHPVGINTSATVGHFIRSGGAPWAQSKIILTDSMNLDSLSSISMKVYTDAPVGTMLKLKVESTGSLAANERDAFTTVSGGWATYTWDFAGDPTIYNVLTFMLGYGSIGDASPTSTFLIDDIEQVPPPPPIPTATMPIDFEDSVTTSYFLDFDGAGAIVTANPEMSGINTSDSVAKLVRNGGQVWAGSILYLDSNLDFSSLSAISMKVFTEAPVGTLVKLKLEGDGGAETEVDVLTTTSGAWETMTWDFTGEPADFNTLVFMFDFGSIGDSSATSTFLFDDIEQVPPPAPTPTTSLPIDFEDVVSTSYFVDFDGAGATVIANPEMGGINTSDSVAKLVRNGGQIWAGSKLYLDSNLDFSSMSYLAMKVFTQAPVGTTVKFKLEGDGGAETEVDVLTTVSGEWETLTWDFTGEPADFHTLVFMFDFGTVGDSSATSTFLFDDIVQTSDSGTIGIDPTLNLAGVHCFPNPATNRLNITSDHENITSISLYDVLGNQVSVLHPNSHSATIEVADFARGVYVAKISTLTAVGSIKFIVE